MIIPLDNRIVLQYLLGDKIVLIRSDWRDPDKKYLWSRNWWKAVKDRISLLRE